MKVAAIQMCSTAVVEENLLMAERLIQEAAVHGAKLVVLPEMFAIMAEMTALVQAKEIFGDGKIQRFLCDVAKKNNIWLVGGTIPIASEKANKVSAACLVIDDQGNIVARYNKIHLFDVVLSENEFYRESASTEAGKDVIVVETPIGKLGLAVCYDIRFPELFRRMVNQGAEVFALPAAFTMKTGEAHWELLARARAVENFCYFIGAAEAGELGNGRHTYGHSLIVDPWGVVLAEEKSSAVGVIYADINLQHLYVIRKSIPALDCQKMLFKS